MKLKNLWRYFVKRKKGLKNGKKLKRDYGMVDEKFELREYE